MDNIAAFRILGATGILLVVFILGSVGYHFIEEMGFFDGFYMTFITITTIGFAELVNLSASGRILTMCLFVIGIGIISYIASQTTQLLFESEIFRKRVSLHNYLKHLDVGKQKPEVEYWADFDPSDFRHPTSSF